VHQWLAHFASADTVHRTFGKQSFFTQDIDAADPWTVADRCQRKSATEADKNRRGGPSDWQPDRFGGDGGGHAACGFGFTSSTLRCLLPITPSDAPGVSASWQYISEWPYSESLDMIRCRLTTDDDELFNN